MSISSVPTLDVSLNIEVNTEESCARMVQTVLEILLFQRNQIPFCYDVLKTLVRRISSTTNKNDQLSEWSTYQFSKQLATVQKAAEAIEILFQQLTLAVQKSKPDSQFMILFGPTIYTAKEAFVINIPEINTNHYPQYHRHSMETMLKQLAMKVTVAEELHDKPKVTSPTNTFLLLNLSPIFTELSEEDVENWQMIDDYSLPNSCQKYIINLFNQSTNSKQLHCCKEMEVFNDQVKDLGIAKQRSQVFNQETLGSTSGKTWFQIGNGLKGLKNNLIKGKSIWHPVR
ncbi:uncharacterized protein LOC129721405 [Wyeomyia smithii]|uniref:uncharacterized protein LOC129721405 n=1 Tax=Wyeomyia smithii TaxID=174621 RepID=UPI002467BF20|nr:uncharacterized protein LOC129721405 [Wyeomyia smithii]